MKVRSLFPATLVALALLLLAAVVLKIARMPWSPAGELVQEAAAPASLRLFVIGDSGSGDAAQHAVAGAMEARCRQQGGVDGLVILGDIVYPAGVESATDPRWDERVWDVYGSPCLGQAPVYPVLGNHDYHGSARAMVAHSGKNPRWRLPHRFYEVRFGGLLRLLAADNWFYDFCLDPQRCAMAFLDQALDAGSVTDGPWRIAISHFPLDSASARGGAHRGGLRGWLTRPLVCGRVHAWLAGHAHHLEHRSLRDCHIDHFVSGGGGRHTYEIRDDPGATFAAQAHGFLEIVVREEALRFRFFDAAGKELYRFARLRPH